MALVTGAARTVGHYELIRRLGRGGMGVVYLARHQRSGREVAIKELAFGLTDDPEATRRFAREASLTASLQHPNVVVVDELFWEQDAPFIAMEYLPGGSLRSRVGHLGAAEAARVLEAVLAGLAHAHSRGIVHRDLKPENLLFARDGTVKIADFGIAKALEQTAPSAPSGVLGSPTYLAPEQAGGGDVGPWTDLYSVGVVAYELFTGLPPFRAPAAPELLLRHANARVPAPRAARRDLPAALERWLLALLEKDPRRRPRDAAAVAEQLRAIMAAEPAWRAAPPPPARVVDGEPTEIERPRRRPAARRLAAVTAAAALIALLVFTSWMDGLERASADARFNVRGTRDAPSDIVIVAIDEDSLDQLAVDKLHKWPLPRDLDARLIDVLRRDHARVIAYRVLFTTQSVNHKQDDLLLEAVRHATRAGTKIVLADQEPIRNPRGIDVATAPAVFGGGDGLRFTGAVAASSSDHPDPDAVIRRMEWGVGRPALAVATAGLARGRAIPPGEAPAPTPWIDFAGPAGTFDTLPLSRVLFGAVPARVFADKVVVVGSTAPSVQDVHRTPTAAAMSGPELLANEIWTARHGFPLRDASAAAALLLGVLLALVPWLALLWRGRTAALVAAAVAAAVYVVAAAVAFANGTVLPVARPLAALAVAAAAAWIAGRRRRDRGFAAL
jgi:CHASE2 domain-containing sensor protein/predicted Ser/Thr protein kinase